LGIPLNLSKTNKDKKGQMTMDGVDAEEQEATEQAE